MPSTIGCVTIIRINSELRPFHGLTITTTIDVFVNLRPLLFRKRLQGMLRVCIKGSVSKSVECSLIIYITNASPFETKKV